MLQKQAFQFSQCCLLDRLAEEYDFLHQMSAKIGNKPQKTAELQTELLCSLLYSASLPQQVT